MFYSHQILARKGPLAIVWIAAHLQHRLRKTHYVDADILPIIDRILIPEAPIALRMSGHLLLGVVRIYSKKAEYLFIDCNEAVAKVAKMFTTTTKEVHTEEGAPTAAFEDITLPERYELDAMDLDLRDEGDADGFRKDPEEITLPDQTPISRDPYIGRTFDEDILIVCSNNDVPDSSGNRPMEGGQLPDQIVNDGNVGVSMMEADAPALYPTNSGLPSRDSGPSNQTEIVNDSLQCQGPDQSNQTNSNVRFEDHGQNNQTEIVNDSIQFLYPDQSNQTNSNVRFEGHGQNNQTETVNDSVQFLDPDQSNQTSRVNERMHQDASPENIPEIEVMRDAVHDSSLFEMPMQHNLLADITIPHSPVDHVTNEKESPSPAVENMLHSAGQSAPFLQHTEQHSFAASDRVPDVFDTHLSLGHVSPNLELRSTPPMEQERLRQRKRKLVDRGPIVFSNDYMKEALNSSDHLLRKKVRLPNSFLGVWKLGQTSRKEQIFFEPSTTGLCADLGQINRDFICTRPNLVLSDEAFRGPSVIHPPDPINESRTPNEGSSNSRHQEISFDTDMRCLQQNEGQAGSSQRDLAEYTGSLPEQNTQVECTRQNKVDPSNSAQGHSSALPEDDTQVECRRQSDGDTRNSAQGPSVAGGLTSLPECHTEIEHRRDCEDDYGGNYVPDFVPSPFRKDDFVPVSVDTPLSEPMDFGSGVLPTPDLGASTGAHGSDFSARTPIFQEQLQFEVPNFSGIPDLVNSTLYEELNFLEDDNAEIGTPGMRDFDTVTVRTRAVAKYLKGNSPATPTSEGPLGDISLNKILEGKSRKLCARMFFETLVLKSYGYVDTQQQEPYGDITLKLSSTLKSQF